MQAYLQRGLEIVRPSFDRVVEFLQSTRNVAVIGGVVALLFLWTYGLKSTGMADVRLWRAALGAVHVGAGVLWLGLIYQSALSATGADGRLSGTIGTGALFWQKWAAVGAVLTGLMLAKLDNELVPTLTLGLSNHFINVRHTLLGLGMWIALAMAANLWLIRAPRLAAGAKGEADVRAIRLSLLADMAASFSVVVVMTVTHTLFGS
jgi:uncharacterized membrane protein